MEWPFGVRACLQFLKVHIVVPKFQQQIIMFLFRQKSRMEIFHVNSWDFFLFGETAHDE